MRYEAQLAEAKRQADAGRAAVEIQKAEIGAASQERKAQIEAEAEIAVAQIEAAAAEQMQKAEAEFREGMDGIANRVDGVKQAARAATPQPTT
jgi:soluble cytochrome b562